MCTVRLGLLTLPVSVIDIQYSVIGIVSGYHLYFIWHRLMSSLSCSVFNCSSHTNQSDTNLICSWQFVFLYHWSLCNWFISYPMFYYWIMVTFCCVHSQLQRDTGPGPDVIKLFFMFNLAEHEIYPATKSKITKNCNSFLLNTDGHENFSAENFMLIDEGENCSAENFMLS